MDSPVDVIRIRAWLNEFLSVHGVRDPKPDGRPLFAYKTTTDEYRQLAELLSAASRHAEDTAAYAQAWFLYAAEWWKRDYSGGAWAWSPVFQSLGRTAPDHAHIQELVIKARKHWGLTGDLLGGKKYIGQVAINGGLPLRLLEAAQGNLARILKTALQHAVAHSLDKPQIYAEVESQAALLPRSYRQAMVFDLLTSVVEAVKTLRAQHGLAGERDPIKKLEDVDPRWMDQFPLAFDSNSAALLLNGLVREAASAGQQGSRQPFQIVRGLRFASDGSAKLELSFEMPAAASQESIGKALQIDHSKLPAVFQLLLRINGRDYLVGEAHLREDSVRLLPKRSEIPVDLARSGVQLIASRYGSTITVTNLPGGDALDNDEPWIFEDCTPLARLIRAGSACVKGASAIALVPELAVVFPDEGAFEELPPTGIPEKQFIRLPTGVTRIAYKKQSYRIRCDASVASDEGIYWQGKTLGYPSVPELLFVDRPILRYSLPGGALATAPATELFQKIPGKDRVSLVSPNAGFGPCRVSWEKNNDIQSQIRAVLLPENASVEFEAGRSALEGTIWLRNWPCRSVTSLSESISVSPQRVGQDWRLDVCARNAVSVQSVPVKVLWESGEQKLTLPFPGEGAIILDAEGRPLPRKSWLSIGMLLGSKVILMPNQRKSSWRIRLSLNGQSATAKQIMRTIHYGQASEIRLFELTDSVKQLISCVTDLDVSVSMQVLNGQTIHAEVLIGRYARQVRSSGSDRRIHLTDGQRELGPSETEDVELLAIPIQFPEQEPLLLAKVHSEGMFTGTWDGDLSDRQHGTWIVFPNSKHSVDCRPLAIAGGTAESPSISMDSALRDALGEADRHTRISLIGAALRAMAYRPEHQEWPLVEVIQQKLGQLPLSGMDLWIAFSQQPAAMVMAFLHIEGFAEGMAARVPAELPFEWLLTSPQQWTRAFTVLKSFYLSQGDERGFRFLHLEIDRKKQQILHLQPGLKFILQLAYHYGFDIPDPEVRFYQANPNLVIDPWLRRQFEGEASELQSLLRRSLTDQEAWPSELKAKTDRFLQTPAGREIISHVLTLIQY